MTTRREFIQQAAGIAFTSCAMLDAAHAQPAAAHSGKRRQVVVAGKRVKTVDVHAHCVIPEAMALMAMPARARAPVMPNPAEMRCFIGVREFCIVPCGGR